MKTDELRQKYLDFFEGKGHKVCPSDVLVPTWDPSVLFTPAGMNQFKDHFLGKVNLEFTRATTSQKCLRTGDIENVGRTPYHHTFFEMLGNFSFGDYFKRDAINWAWEFLTDKKWLGMSPDQLTVTVYLDDNEAADIWSKDIGLSSDRITRMDEHDNFWPAGAPTDGPDGVCGPCSEIFFHPHKGPEVEIWNLVFTQFNRKGDPPNNLEPLPSKNIDTGMGLERAAATLQGVVSNYDIDILRPICEAAAEVCSIHYDPESDNGRRLRRITDHVRACTFAIHENVYPGPNKEQYVIKRLLRRAVLDGRQMGLHEPFLFKLVPAVVHAMGHPYPELSETQSRVAKAIEHEEANFFNTIDDGLARIDQIFNAIQKENSNIVNGEQAADLYTTYGVPPELVESMASDKQWSFDWDGYKNAMDRHSKESGKIAETVMGNFGPIDEIKSDVKSSKFLGYETMSSQAVIKGIVGNDSVQTTWSAEEEPARELGKNGNANQSILILDQSPFYGESGGQVGDTGMVESKNGKFEVTDTQRDADLILHYGRAVEGVINIGDEVTATVDEQRRSGIRRAHSATHILHHALQKHLGTHAQQRGSKVEDDLLRFDFTNLEPVTDKELEKIENESIAHIKNAEPVKAETLPLADARSRGAMMLFGEKYPDPVRMVSMGEFSKELCGGTHLENTSEVETFEITSEEGISAGTRRIIALTGNRAIENEQKTRTAVERVVKILNCHALDIPDAVSQLSQTIKSLKKMVSTGTGSNESITVPASNHPNEPTYVEIRSALRQCARRLNVSLFEVPSRIQSMLENIAELEAQLEKAKSSERIDADQLIQSAESSGDIKIIVQELPGANPNSMRLLVDQIRKKSDRVAIFFATIAGSDKVLLVAGVSRELVSSGISAGDWIKEVAPIVGGGGGGKPDLAQAGGKQPENIKQALIAAQEYIRSSVVS